MRNAVTALPLLFVIACGPAVAQTLPQGFTTDTVVTGINQPVAMSFTSDGRFFVTGQSSGEVWCCMTNGSKTLAGIVPNVRTGSERGLLGIAVDPAWPSSPYIYVCWSHTFPSPSMRIARYTITGAVNDPTSTAVALGARFDIITNLPDNAFNHNGGTLRFGPDDMLYASFGDDASSCSAQDSTDGRGVILRMDVSGLPAGSGGPPSVAAITPAGNPFSGSGFAPITWAYGLRNPFRFTIDQVTGSLYIGDVGQSAWEELDEASTGGLNFGWPLFEGNAGFTTCVNTSGPYVAPIATISQSTGAASIIAWPRYRNVTGGPFSFGSSFEGDVFYSDYFNGRLYRLTWNGTSWVTPAPLPGQPSGSFGAGFSAVCDAVMGPDGAIYYVRQSSAYGSGAGTINRLKGDANAPQLIKISGDNQVGNSGWPLSNPLVVQLQDPSGAPMPNTSVTFSPSGGGTVSPAVVSTDANGMASTIYTLSPTFSSSSVQVSAAGATPVMFNAVWRGLTINYLSGINTAVVTFRHSEPGSPWTLAWEPPAPNPYVTTSWGEIWTSVLAPVSGFAALDGLGLLGMPDPSMVTGSNNTWVQVFSNLPPTGGLTLLFQGYALDTTLLPADEAVVISAPVTVTLN